MDQRAVYRPRLLPDRALPAYAYLPGKFPHPVRDPQGHSYIAGGLGVCVEPAPSAEDFAWGVDLFNHGYYWEAHEAWEPLWKASTRGSTRRALLKGLILLSAAGVKLREAKHPAAARHGKRAAMLLRLAAASDQDRDLDLGMSPARLASYVEDATAADRPSATSDQGRPEAVFQFVLCEHSGPATR